MTETSEEQEFIQIPQRLGGVGPGWHPLLLQLHEDILQLDPKYHVLQLKEKFGGLRVYVATVDPEAFNLIHLAADKAATICEYCGNSGSLRQSPRERWYRATCDEHLNGWPTDPVDDPLLPGA